MARKKTIACNDCGRKFDVGAQAKLVPNHSHGGKRCPGSKVRFSLLIISDHDPLPESCWPVPYDDDVVGRVLRPSFI